MRALAFVLLGLAACSKPRPEKVADLPAGEAVRPEDYLRPGYATILEFTRAGCGPCVELAPELERMTEKYDRVLLRRVDILRSGTAAAEQMTREFSGRDVPHVVVFGADGASLGPVVADPKTVEQAVFRALVRRPIP